MVRKLEKCKKLTKGHNLVKNMIFENLKSHAHLQIMAKYSDVERVVGTNKVRARLFKTNDVISQCFVKISNVNI